MFKGLLLILAAVSCSLGAGISKGILPQPNGRIVGGKVADIKDNPWQAAILKSDGYLCAGSIIKNNVILTTAHCVDEVKVKDITVRVGSSEWDSSGTNFTVVEIKAHDGYQKSTLLNNVAVIQLNGLITSDSTASSIKMSEKAPKDSEPAKVTGWGYSSPGSTSTTLYSAKVNIISRSECASSKYNYGSTVIESMICAAGKDQDACLGDDGAPLVSDKLLVGMVSAGIGCDNSDFPGIYTDVASVHEWILKTIALW